MDTKNMDSTRGIQKKRQRKSKKLEDDKIRTIDVKPTEDRRSWKGTTKTLMT